MTEKQPRVSGGIRVVAATALVVAGASAAVHAAPPLNWNTWTPVADSELATMRGGFVGRDFRIDFSYENVVRVNGELRAQTVVRMPVGQVSRQGRQEVQLIQNGPGNHYESESSAGARRIGNGGLVEVITDVGRVLSPREVPAGVATATVIQNSLDNQVIQNLKFIHVDVAGLGQVRQMGLQRRLDSGIVEALR